MYGRHCTQSVRHYLVLNIFPSGPPTQSKSTLYSFLCLTIKHEETHEYVYNLNTNPILLGMTRGLQWGNIAPQRKTSIKNESAVKYYFLKSCKRGSWVKIEPNPRLTSLIMYLQHFFRLVLLLSMTCEVGMATLQETSLTSSTSTSREILNGCQATSYRSFQD